MINNENYAEVSRVLGQSETDKQLAFLGQALCEALPSLKNNPNFTSAADNWNRRNNTWPSELIKRVKERKPPRHTVASISSLNNAHAVYIHQVNDQRRSIKDGLLKQVDDQTTRIRNAEQKLHDMQQSNRKQYDEDRSQSEKLLTQCMPGHCHMILLFAQNFQTRPTKNLVRLMHYWSLSRRVLNIIVR